uniref:Uncharacterized protein n=1 Tax=Strombidium inclinatum TaxID=197538 RepID=A0A7S3IEQ6_9SPIT|mmetsp:Transcript_12909/g.20001  ORF Transcript_12909/g.20001 Transcript_12909/m.20001 type:complete len:279 (+) Transcript_12909:746-1582(+)
MIWLMNGATGDYLACFSGHENDVLEAQFTPANGGKTILSASADMTMRLWSPKQHECLRVIKAPNTKTPWHEDAINTFALHPTRPVVVSGDLSGKVFLSNYNTGEIAGCLGQHGESVESIDFCPSDVMDFCVSVGMDTNINIYNIKEHKLRQKVTIGDSEYGGFTKVKFSAVDPNMLYAASTQGYISIIDVRNGSCVRTYRGHAAPINDFLEVVEHKILVTAGDDFQCNVYDLTQEPKSLEIEKQKEEMQKEFDENLKKIAEEKGESGDKEGDEEMKKE